MIRRRVAKALFGRTTKADELHLPDILRQETVGGMLMLGAAVVALLWANLMPESYDAVAHFKLGPLDLAHWAADGLLALFFFVAGLELRRELTEGALAKPANAAVPIAAAMAGVALPALIFVGVNVFMPGGDLRGWAIPMATDIAFALAVLAIVGSHLPSALRSFLLTMAIVDDVVAVLIIAVFFTSDISWLHLLGAVFAVAVWAVLQQSGVRQWWIYLPLALLTWWLTFESGVHATIAGVVLGTLVYASAADTDDILDRWEHSLRPISAGFAVPVFALFAAGVHIEADQLLTVITHPVSLGIIGGLVLGKLLGVFSGAYFAGQALNAKPTGTRWREVAGVAQMSGIGFTVSLLLADLAFDGDTELSAMAKAAVLIGSLVSALLGAVVLARRNRVHRDRHHGNDSPEPKTTETH